jgi:hypothetical protein
MIFFLLAFSLLAHSEEAANVGPGKAVTAIDGERFQMSEKALNTLKVRFAPWKSEVPVAALVRIQDSTGIFQRSDGWISFEPVKVLRQSGGSAFIQSFHLKADAEIAVEGALFLRITEADLHSESAGHSH